LAVAGRLKYISVARRRKQERGAGVQGWRRLSMNRKTYLKVVLVFFIIAVAIEATFYGLLLAGIRPFK
jgi:hypothetical protein